jgi:hypothetical protein
MSDTAKRAALEYYKRAVFAGLTALKVADAVGVAYDAATDALQKARRAESECAKEALAVGVTENELKAAYAVLDS